MKEGMGNTVISTTIVDDYSDSFDETTITKNMAPEIYGVFENEESAINGKVEITNLYTPKELRDEARKHGVSAGKVAIRLLSIEQGQHLEWEELQEKAIAQIAEELGGWDQLIATDEEITKDRLKELYNLQKQTVQMPNDVKTSNSKEEEDEEPSSLDTEVDDIEAVPESSKQNSTRNLPAFVKQPDNDDVSYTLASSQVSESEEMVQLKNVENRGNHGNDGSRVSRLKERAKEQTRHHDHGQRKMKKRDRHGPKEQKAESTDDFAQKERRQSHHHTDDNDQAKNQRHRKNHQGKH